MKIYCWAVVAQELKIWRWQCFMSSTRVYLCNKRWRARGKPKWNNLFLTQRRRSKRCSLSKQRVSSTEWAKVSDIEGSIAQLFLLFSTCSRLSPLWSPGLFLTLSLYTFEVGDKENSRHGACCAGFTSTAGTTAGVLKWKQIKSDKVVPI